MSVCEELDELEKANLSNKMVVLLRSTNYVSVNGPKSQIPHFFPLPPKTRENNSICERAIQLIPQFRGKKQSLLDLIASQKISLQWSHEKKWVIIIDVSSRKYLIPPINYRKKTKIAMYFAGIGIAATTIAAAAGFFLPRQKSNKHNIQDFGKNKNQEKSLLHDVDRSQTKLLDAAKAGNITSLHDIPLKNVLEGTIQTLLHDIEQLLVDREKNTKTE